MLKETQEQLANSLTAETPELLPFLPYLLQDFWALGVNPGVITDLIVRHAGRLDNMIILDLACGKGAVSVRLAQKLGVQVKGIDLIPEFIDYAANKAREFQVQDLCEFVVGDINQAVKMEKEYDCVIFGAIGSALGNRRDTLNKLKGTVKQGGYVLLDNYDFTPPEQWAAVFRETGLELVEAVRDEDQMQAEDNDSFRLISDSALGLAAITRRANELIKRYPDRKALFENYIRSQENEYEEIENQDSYADVTWILKR